MFKKITLTVIIAFTLILIKLSVSTGSASSKAYSMPGNIPGFEPATTITDADAYNYANQFKTTFTQIGSVSSGGVITREALDALLATKDCNAISYKLCTDPSGRFAPANTVFLVLSSAKVTVANGVATTTETGTTKYTSRQWCPPACMKFMVRDANGNLVPQE